MPKELHYCVKGLMTAGISLDDAVALRRISMTLHRWHEAECNGEIQRDEATNIPYWYNTHTNKKNLESCRPRNRRTETPQQNYGEISVTQRLRSR